MLKYKNKKTGRIVTANGKVVGKNWERVETKAAVVTAGESETATETAEKETAKTTSTKSTKAAAKTTSTKSTKAAAKTTAAKATKSTTKSIKE